MSVRLITVFFVVCFALAGHVFGSLNPPKGFRAQTEPPRPDRGDLVCPGGQHTGILIRKVDGTGTFMCYQCAYQSDFTGAEMQAYQAAKGTEQ